MKFYYKMILSVLLVVLILSFVNVITYKMRLSDFHNHVNIYNKKVMQDVYSEFEKAIEEANNTFYLLSSLKYAPVSKYTGQIDRYQTYKLHQELLNIGQSSKYIYDVIVFFNNSSLVLTTNGTNSFSCIFNDIYHNTKYHPSFWRGISLKSHSMQIIPSCEYTNKIRSLSLPLENNFYSKELIGILPGNKLVNYSFNILFFIDVDKLFSKNTTRNSYLDNVPFAILDAQNNIVLNAHNMNSSSLIDLSNNYDKSKKEMIIEKNSKKYYLSFSKKHNFIIINEIKEYKNLAIMKRINLILLVFSVLFGIIASFVLSSIFYSPIKRILNELGLKDDKMSKNSPLHIIGQNVKLLKNRTSRLNKSIDLLKKEKIYFLLKKAVKGSIANEKEFKNTFMKDFTEKSFYTVISIDVTYSKSYLNKVDRNSKDLIYKSVERKIADFWKTGFPSSYLVEIEPSKFISVITIDNIQDRSQIQDTLQTLMNDFKSTHSEIYLIAALSNVKKDVNDINIAYDEILECIKFRPLSVEKLILTTENIDKFFSGYLPAYSVEKFKNLFMEADKEACIKLIKDVINKNNELGQNIFNFRNICCQFLNSIFSGMSEKKQLDSKENFDYPVLVNRLYSLNTIEEFTAFFDETLNLAISNIDTAPIYKLRTTQEKMEYIKEYIRLHFNEDIYLDKLAEMVNSTPKYISRSFKKTFDINFMDYLNHIRLAHAKELLIDKSLTLEKIAHMVGFNSNSALTNVFNKYLGVSPSQFRKNISKL